MRIPGRASFDRRDQETALAGALGAPCGMVLIAGTGSICFGRDAVVKQPGSGGYGHKIDDEGSGYALGRDALAAVVRAQDGRAADAAHGPGCLHS